MQKTMIVLVAGLFLIACNSESEPATGELISDIASENLKGNIESFVETPYTADSTGKTGQPDSCCTGFAKVSKKGDYVSWTEKDNKGVVKTETVYERFENGIWKGMTRTKEGKPSFGLQTKIDDKGNYISAEEFDSTGKMVYYYTGLTQDKYGHVLTYSKYDKDSVLREQLSQVFDSIYQQSFTVKDSVGKVKNSGLYKYNDKGEQVEATATTVIKDSSTTTVTKYTYDAHDEMGNWTQRTEYNDKGKPVKVLKRAYTYYKKED